MDPFESQTLDNPDRGVSEPAFVVDIDGFEGPLDLLLTLARQQKVDLHRISVLALAEQYLSFIEAARTMRLELAADYLVMAAWLAYLKSRLLLPPTNQKDEPDAAELAAALAFRLRRLEAIRKGAELLMQRPQLGRDMFVRGQSEAPVQSQPVIWTATLYDLLSAYASQRSKKSLSRVVLHQRFVWPIAKAREILEGMVGSIHDWSVLDAYLAHYCTSPQLRRTVRASSFSAMLEMVREGFIEVRQDREFAPMWVKPRVASLLDAVALPAGPEVN